MAYNPVNPNGQTSSANSAPVVIANDQSAVPVTLSGSTSQTKITDGTNVVNVLKSDGTAAGQNAQLIAPAYKEVVSAGAGSPNADLVSSIDVSGYSTFVLQITGTFVGTLTLQGSNDNLNFVSVYGTWIGNTQPVVTISTTGIITGSCNFRYLRVRMTAWTSGTAYGVLELKSVPFAPTNITGQVNATSTAVAGVGMQPATSSIVNVPTAIKATTGLTGTNTPSTLYGWYFFNNNSTVAYCQIFDVSATGGVTLGSTAPTMSFGIPAFGGANAFPTQGIKFSNGIVIAMTTTRNESTAPTNSVDYNIFYQ